MVKGHLHDLMDAVILVNTWTIRNKVTVYSNGQTVGFMKELGLMGNSMVEGHTKSVLEVKKKKESGKKEKD